MNRFFKATFSSSAPGSATHGIWLRNRKVGSQVIGKDRSQLPGRKQLRKIVQEKQYLSTERRRECTDLGSDLGKKEREINMSIAMPQSWFWQ